MGSTHEPDGVGDTPLHDDLNTGLGTGHVVTISAAGSHRFHIGGLNHSALNQSKNLRSPNSDPPEA